MNSLVKIFLASALLVCTHAALLKIKTDVYVSKTGFDLGNLVELKTTITESGNGQIQTSTQTFNTLPENKMFPGLGVLVASATFSGTKLPTTMKVRMIESDAGTTSKDDGICYMEVTPPFFSFTPTTIKCIREGDDGLSQLYVVTARITRV